MQTCSRMHTDFMDSIRKMKNRLEIHSIESSLSIAENNQHWQKKYTTTWEIGVVDKRVMKYYNYDTSIHLLFHSNCREVDVTS